MKNVQEEYKSDDILESILCAVYPVAVNGCMTQDIVVEGVCVISVEVIENDGSDSNGGNGGNGGH